MRTDEIRLDVRDSAGLPPGTRVVLDRRLSSWRGDRLILGGSPWRVVRLSASARDLIGRLRAVGPAGLVPSGPTDRAAVDLLVERGFIHPVAVPRAVGGEVAVVIPAYGRPDRLAACLAAVNGPATGHDIVVVDDASPDEAANLAVVHAHGARRIRHEVNQGPGAARNTGLAATSAPVVAFLDSDCTPEPGWLDALLPLFDDPRVGAVAPRVRPRPAGQRSLLARHEEARSALDMGRHRALVRPGAALGFLPSAALVVRRAALASGAFDASMRVGEDVDLVWRLADAGWHVRYEPTVTVLHDGRLRPTMWLRRRFEYGTSAADLDRRHPGRLAPARPSAWNLVTTALLVANRPAVAAAVSAAAAAILGRRLQPVGGGLGLAAVVVGKGVIADAVAIGHALRREWWPVGWAAVCGSGSSRLARSAAAAMLAPLVLEWLRGQREVDPGRYVLLRLVEDAAYGTGVIASAVRRRHLGVLLPVIRQPDLRWRRPSRQPDGLSPEMAVRQWS
jgi:mycofactocin system glycosyltransferase